MDVKGSDGIVKRADGSAIRQRRARAAYSYEPQQDDELALKVGDEVFVHGEDEEGWYQATVNGKSGVCPSNFLEFLSDIHAGVVDDTMSKKDVTVPVDNKDSTKKDLLKEKLNSSLKEEANKRQSQFSSVLDPLALSAAAALTDNNNGQSAEDNKTPDKPKKIQGVGLGDIFAGGQVKLRSTNADSNGKMKLIGPSDKKASIVNSAEANKSDNSHQQHSSGEYAKADFDYEAQNGDELSFKAGDIIRIITKDCEDEGWWKGELDEATGVFPDNFCKIIPLSEVPTSRRMSKGSHDKVIVKKPDSSNVAVEKHETKQQHPLKHPVEKSHATREKEKPAVKPSLPEKPERPAKLPAKPVLVKKPTPAPSATTTSRSQEESPLTDAKANNHDRHPEEKIDSSVEKTGHKKIEEVESLTLDAVNTDKLSHPTAARARGPNRRPPSIFRPNSEEEKSPNGFDFANLVKEPQNGTESGDKKSEKDIIKDIIIKDLDNALSRSKSPLIKKLTTDAPVQFSTLDEEIKWLREELKSVKDDFGSQLRELKELLNSQMEKSLALEKELDQLKKAK